MLPPDLHSVFDELLEDYKFAAIKHHGQGFVSAMVIAEIVLVGWRCSASQIEPVSESVN